MQATANFANITQLPLRERMRLFETLWDSFATQPNDVTVPHWHTITLKNRLDKYRNAPKTGENWSTVKQKIEAQLQSNN